MEEMHSCASFFGAVKFALFLQNYRVMDDITRTPAPTCRVPCLGTMEEKVLRAKDAAMNLGSVWYSYTSISDIKYGYGYQILGMGMRLIFDISVWYDEGMGIRY